jgi:GT2 family glycosyltransferase
MSEILVVIPTIIKNSFKDNLLDQLCAESLVKQVVVVDNGNCFYIPLEKQQAWAKVQRLEAGCNLNWLTSCNIGAAIAIAQQIPYVCFLNDDVKLSNMFFEEMIKTFNNCKDAAVVVPRYTGYCITAKDLRNETDWKPEEKEEVVGYIDGTCMLISLQTLKTVGLLDPIFQPPGWGADLDYSHRVKCQKKSLYVSYRAMLWHGEENKEKNSTVFGGTSAMQIYGSKSHWVYNGCQQITRDMNYKYGQDWQKVLNLQELNFKSGRKPD